MPDHYTRAGNLGAGGLVQLRAQYILAASRWRRPARMPRLSYRAFLLLFLLLTACSTGRPAPTGETTEAVSKSVPLASPAMVLDELFALAVDQRVAGEYEDAQSSLERLLGAQPDAALERAARYEQARLLLELSRPDDALAILEPLSRGDDSIAERSMFLIGRAHELAGRANQAIDAFRRYRRLATVVEPYAALREAAQQLAAGRNGEALALYTSLAQQPLAHGRRLEVLEKLIELQPEDAARRRDALRELIALADQPAYRAQLLWRAAREAPEGDESRGWIAELIGQHAATPEALEALGSYDAAPLQAAAVYFAHERWAEAVPLFDAALAGELSDAERFEARRKRALAQRALALYADALAELGDLAQQRPAVSITATAQAELDYVQTVGWQGNTAWAIDGYRRFAERFSEHELAPEALWRAIQLQRQSDIEGAMAAAIELGRVFPHSVQAHIALTDAGLHFYTTQRRDRAIEAWQLLGDGASGTDSAEGNFWAGNALVQSGKGGEAGARLEAAASAAPQSYYGARALEMLSQVADGAVALGSGLPGDERAAVAAWLSGWAGPAPSAAAAPELDRAAELWHLGLVDEARDEWLTAADAAGENGQLLWRLALHAHDTDEPYIALKIAERLIELSPAGQVSAATPAGVLRLLYPTPFARVMQREAQSFDIDPRLLYGLLRQESLFRPDVTSWAGARGLGQIMPGTGEGIAQRLGMADFTPELLYRPAVSIRFAAHYISAQLQAFDDNVLAAAAAYNGGPGNAARWLENTADRDLFAELIDYRETRDYVKIVYGNWATYRRLYRR